MNLFEIIKNAPENSRLITDSIVITHAKLKGYEKILCSVSGGSDSDILIDLCQKFDDANKITYVFFDTGIEFRATKEHIVFLEEKYNIHIECVKAEKPIPVCCKTYGQPFISKQVSEWIERLQRHDFKWEDKPFDILYKEYPKCRAALRWWCNDFSRSETGKESSFNIGYNQFLKEFMVQNPPDFKISNKCCHYAKKITASKFKSQGKFDLNIYGVRKAEGGARRAAYKTCFSSGKNGCDEYRPIFWYLSDTKKIYEAHYNIEHSRCYDEYGLKRTGCAGCPYGQNFETELAAMKNYEPSLFKVVNYIFKESYEYTRKYRRFVVEMKNAGGINMDAKMIKANPTREFFVNMLVRDILLKQAIIELIDNSIDGARTIKKDNDFNGLKIMVKFDETSFSIQDNCGGIPLSIAEEYAFRFGRPKEKIANENETTGIFGIGMKRALFKIGNYFEIRSITTKNSFEVKLDVEKWESEQSNDWDFPFTSYAENLENSIEKTGTIITVTNLRKEIAADFKSRDFEKELIEHVQRRVGLDIDNGIVIEVNGKRLVGNHVKLVNGENIQPVKETYMHDNVKVKIVAGIAEKNGKENYEPENAGWYIYCNGRLVVAADKTSLTTWKDIENKNSGVVFTNTYASFQGIVSFTSNKPEELPWNTTKTGIDESSVVYLQAKEKMIDIFRIVKGFIDEIRKNTKENDDAVAETIASMPTIELTTVNMEKNIPENRKLSINDVKIKTIPNVIIRYKKPKADVELLKQSLGVSTNSEVGELTFEYYKDAEC